MSLNTYYKTIDSLPIYNYWMVIKKKDLNYLTITGSNNKEVLASIWLMICDEVFEFWCEDPDFIKQTNEDAENAIKEAEAYIKKDKAAKFKIKIERENKSSKKETPPLDLYKKLASLEQKTGLIFDEMKMSTRKFLTHIKIAS
jgi:hypothetical protein